MHDPNTTEPVDWRSILVRYVEAVMDDDICVGDRCLTDPAWCPEWTDTERNALALIRQEARPADQFVEALTTVPEASATNA